MSNNQLNDISRVYLAQVAEETPGEKIDRISQADVAKRKAKAESDRTSRDKKTAENFALWFLSWYCNKHLKFKAFEAADKAVQWPFLYNEDTGQPYIDQSSQYHMDNTPGEGSARVPADASGDPGYEKIIIDDMIDSDKKLF